MEIVKYRDDVRNRHVVKVMLSDEDIEIARSRLDDLRRSMLDQPIEHPADILLNLEAIARVLQFPEIVTEGT